MSDVSLPEFMIYTPVGNGGNVQLIVRLAVAHNYIVPEAMLSTSFQADPKHWIILASTAGISNDIKQSLAKEGVVIIADGHGQDLGREVDCETFIKAIIHGIGSITNH